MGISQVNWLVLARIIQLDRWIRLKMPGHFDAKFLDRADGHALQILPRTDLGLLSLGPNDQLNDPG